MFNKISSGLLGWMNRTETVPNHQPPATSVKDQNNAKVKADTNGECRGANLEDRVIKDCSFCLIDGFSHSRINCEFNHPPNWKPQVGKVKEREESVDSASQEVKEKSDSKAEQVDRKYLDSPGVYKSPKASNVNHSTKPCPAEKLNFMGLPIRQGVRDCSFYMSNGSCKYGENCWFNHPNPISVEEYDTQSGSSSERSILLPNASQSTPGLWSPHALNENHPYVPSMFQGVTSIPEWHDYQAPIYQPERNMQYSTSIQPPERNVAMFPERPGQPECNQFMKTGYCNYTSACKFHHPKNATAKPRSCTLGSSSLPLRPEAVVSPSYDATFIQKNYRKSKTKQPKPVPKEQNAMESVRCELCDIKCASIQLYKKHCYGKKHNLQKLEAQKQMSQVAQASHSTNAAGKTRVVTDLARKEQKLLRRATAVHSMTGQAHVAKANLGPTEKITANPTNGEDLMVLKEEKKHQTNVEKSQIPKVDPTCLASATTLPLMAPPLKEPEGLETKIRKVLECGAPEDSVRTCTICSVVCNSETVFNSHLAGQKHAAAVMVKQAEEETAVTKNLTADETSDKISSSGEMSTQSEKCMVDFKGKERNVLEGGTEVQSPSAFLCSDEPLTGKKHPAQVEALTAKSEPNPNSATIRGPNSSDKITTKSRKDESLWCQLCEIKCTRVEDLMIHKGGRKHKTKMEELQNPKTVETVDPISPDDAEPKIEEVLNCGVAEAVKYCTICYVMCKGESVFNSHMAGKKHASMVKKKQAHEDANANTTNAQGSITRLPVVEHPLA